MSLEELSPDFFYLVMRGGGDEDKARLVQALTNRGVTILWKRNTSSGNGREEDILILKLAGSDHSNLMLELAHEGIDGDLAAYGKRVPGSVKR